MDQSTLAQQLPPMTMWGWVGDALGRRWAMIIPAAIAVALAPVYLLTADFTWIAIGFVVQGVFGGPLYSQLPSYLSERCPTEYGRRRVPSATTREQTSAALCRWC